jgi:hypothetical protein
MIVAPEAIALSCQSHASVKAWIVNDGIRHFAFGGKQASRAELSGFRVGFIRL